MCLTLIRIFPLVSVLCITRIAHKQGVLSSFWADTKPEGRIDWFTTVVPHKRWKLGTTQRNPIKGGRSIEEYETTSGDAGVDIEG
jgi:hypothetical protein